jgi:WhiB family redox-sensing transcriptional regulator
MSSPQMNTTRRGRRPAAQRPVDWKTRSECRGADTDDFFSTTTAEKDRARALCAKCPVIAECLIEHRATDEEIYRWGIGGGLDAHQRRALEMEELLGNHADLALAQLLISPRWLLRLQDLRSSCRSLQEVTRKLRLDGLLVNEVTVRVAVWWSGGHGSRMAWNCPTDLRPLRSQIREDYMDVVLELRAAGARQSDIAAYLGVPGSQGSQAIAKALRAVEVAA